jgi:dihydrofolate reductase
MNRRGQPPVSAPRKLVVGTFLALAGVMQAPGGPNEDRDDGFLHGGWLVPYFDEKIGEIMTEWTNRAGAFLLGRKTYEIFASSWPKSTDPADEIAAALSTRPKFVASRTLDKVEPAAARSSQESELFLKETPKEWLEKYAPGKLKAKRLKLFTGMKGLTTA